MTAILTALTAGGAVKVHRRRRVGRNEINSNAKCVILGTKRAVLCFQG